MFNKLCNVLLFRAQIPRLVALTVSKQTIFTSSIAQKAAKMAAPQKFVFDRSVVGGGGATTAVRQVEQHFDYFLVLDFEATCDNQTRVKPQEIIEFPVLKVNAKSFETEAVFHQYVQPRVHRELTSFCTELTGIVQDMVDGKPFIDNTLQEFNTWMVDQGLLHDAVKFAFVTCGDWDLKIMLPNQAKYFSLQYPNYLRSWINIKKSFADITGEYSKGMMSMLKKLAIRHEGRHHSGIDDCRNIAKILKALGERGYVFQTTGSLQ